MSSSPDHSGFHLNTYQNEFVHNFVSPDSPANHILSAPVGTGKTAVAVAIVNAMLQAEAQRVLIIVPALVLVDQYKQLLEVSERNMKVVAVSRKIVREVDVLGQRESFWAKSVAIAALSQLASAEMKESIFSIAWDLVIFDDPEGVSKNGKHGALILDIIRESTVKRILVLATQTREALARMNRRSVLNSRLFDAFEETRWGRKDLFVGQKFGDLTVKTVPYRRSVQEVDFIRQYERFSKLLADIGIESQIGPGVVSSSLYAAEQSLRKLQSYFAPSDPSSILGASRAGEELPSEELLGEFASLQSSRKLPQKELSKIREDLANLLESLDSIQVDSKFSTLRQIISEADATAQRTWIYASYRWTGSYLYGSLMELGQHVYQAYGATSSGRVGEELDRFAHNGGILISSANRLLGIELPIESLVFYDIPGSEHALYTALSRLTSPSKANANQPASLIILHDATSTLKIEEDRLQRLEALFRRTDVLGI